MLKLAIAVHNPAAEGVIAIVGMVILALVAAVVIVLWVVVARRTAQGDQEDAADDRGIEKLRHLSLVVRSPANSAGAKSVAVAELKPDDEVGAPDVVRPAQSR